MRPLRRPYGQFATHSPFLRIPAAAGAAIVAVVADIPIFDVTEKLDTAGVSQRWSMPVLERLLSLIVGQFVRNCSNWKLSYMAGREMGQPKYHQVPVFPHASPLPPPPRQISPSHLRTSLNPVDVLFNHSYLSVPCFRFLSRHFLTLSF